MSRTGTGAPRGERLERDREAVAADDRRVEAAGDVAQLVERRARSRSRACSSRAARARRRRPAAPPAAPARSDSATSRCCAPSCRLRSSRWRSCWPASMTRAREPLQLSRRALQLGLQPGVLQRDPGGRADRVQQLGLVVQRRVVRRAPRRRAVARRSASSRSARRARAASTRRALGVGPAVELRQPVGERQRRVAQRPRAARRAGRRARVGAQLDEQVPDRRAGEPGAEQARRGTRPARARGRRTSRRRIVSNAGSSKAPATNSSTAIITRPSANESTSRPRSSGAGDGRSPRRCAPARRRRPGRRAQ